MAFDAVTFMLLQNKIKKSETGISKIEVRQKPGSDEYQLVFIMANGKENIVDLPIKPDCIDFKFVNELPISGISKTTVYLLDKGNDIYHQYMFVEGVWTKMGMSGIPFATKDEVGVVKPDDITLQVDADGTLSIKKEGFNNLVEEFMDDSDNKISDDDINNFLDWD